MPDVLELCKELPGGFVPGKEIPLCKYQLLDMPGTLDQYGEMLGRLDELLDIPSNVDLSQGGEMTESLCHGGDVPGDLVPGDVMPGDVMPGDVMPGDVMPGRMGPEGGPGVPWCPAYWLLGREEGGQRIEDRG